MQEGQVVEDRLPLLYIYIKLNKWIDKQIGVLSRQIN